MEYLKREEPDILCLQEVKSSEGTQPPELKSIENYPHAYWSFSEHQGHYGVGLISKVKPENVVNGLPIKDSDSEKDKKLKEMYNTEGRLITAEFDKFFLIDVCKSHSCQNHQLHELENCINLTYEITYDVLLQMYQTEAGQ